jgi:hypothetical protein
MCGYSTALVAEIERARLAPTAFALNSTGDAPDGGEIVSGRWCARLRARS